jgi:antitoxin component YwqK of YwqJK toxin-antitoxin module
MNLIKTLTLFLIILMFYGCDEVTVDYQENIKDIVTENGVLIYKGEPFSGKMTSNYEDGSLEKVESFDNGLLNGVSKYYYSNGELGLIESYKDGDVEGEVTIFYKNGSIYEKYIVKDGEINGEHLLYQRDGRLTSRKVFENGELMDQSVINQ